MPRRPGARSAGHAPPQPTARRDDGLGRVLRAAGCGVVAVAVVAVVVGALLVLDGLVSDTVRDVTSGAILLGSGWGAAAVGCGLLRAGRTRSGLPPPVLLARAPRGPAGLLLDPLWAFAVSRGGLRLVLLLAGAGVVGFGVGGAGGPDRRLGWLVVGTLLAGVSALVSDERLDRWQRAPGSGAGGVEPGRSAFSGVAFWLGAALVNVVGLAAVVAGVLDVPAGNDSEAVVAVLWLAAVFLPSVHALDERVCAGRRRRGNAVSSSLGL